MIKTAFNGKTTVLRGLIATALLVTGLTALCQPTSYFEILDDHNNWVERSSNAILLNDSIYWTTAGYNYSQEGATHLSFLKIGQDGQILREVVDTVADNRYHAGHIAAYGDSGILCLTSFDLQVEATDRPEFRLTAFDTVGNIMWEQTYADSGFTSWVGQLRKISEGYLIIGQRSDDDDGDMVVLKVDDFGNLIWRKTYGGSSYEAGRSAVETMDGGYLLLGWTRSYGAGQRDLYLVKTDSEGNEQWYETYGTGAEEIGTNIIFLQDGKVLLTGSGTNAAITVSLGKLYKIDFNGDVIWSETYTYQNNTGHNFHQSLETSNGDIITVGMTNDQSNAGWLIRTDSLGEVLWQREYDYNSQTDLFYGVLAMDDGGFLLSGQAHPLSHSQDAWLLKVDSVGCPYPNCTVGIDEQGSKEILVNVWPNPVSDVLNIELTDPSASIKMSVFDMNGKVVFKHVQKDARAFIDVSAWVSGSYILNGIDDKARSFSIKLLKK